MTLHLGYHQWYLGENGATLYYVAWCDWRLRLRRWTLSWARTNCPDCKAPAVFRRVGEQEREACASA